MDKNEPWKEYIGQKGEVAPIGPRGHHDDPGPDSPEERKHKIVLSNIDSHGLILRLADQSLSRNGFMKVLHVIEEETGSIIDWGLTGDPGVLGAQGEPGLMPGTPD